jgi:transposase-like protein
MKEANNELLAQSSPKSGAHTFSVRLEGPLLDMILNTRTELDGLIAQVGLQVIRGVLDQEIATQCGTRGQQKAYRHGSQPGYVIFAGRKVTIRKPRVRQKGGAELALATYKAFQQEGPLQKAIGRNLRRQVSTRNYAGAIDDCIEGYGIAKSSVSRHWKALTEAELRAFSQRPVPADIVALVIDGQYFRRECLVVAMGVDFQGKKHVLGLWHGATENSTLVRELLADLRERGLNTEAAMLVVIDGAKALAKGVKEVFGDRALIQRCRVHKLRNVLEHLPMNKRQQAAWRLRGAWAKSSPEAALKELLACVSWLEKLSPSAARSLEEGLEETLTVNRLALPLSLVRSFNSTNLIESCFARTEEWTKRVKHWHDANMVMRWGAAALLFAEKGFYRIRGAENLGKLIHALEQHQNELVSLRKAA